VTIKSVDVDWTNIPDNSSILYFGNFPIYKLGYFAFIYGDAADGEPRYGALEWCNFKHQVFFPVNEMATGFSVYGLVGSKWDAKVHYSQLNPLDTKVLGDAVNLATGRFGGLLPMAAGGFVNGNPVATFIGQPPKPALPLYNSTYGAPK
jgi:hypothetical protein